MGGMQTYMDRSLVWIQLQWVHYPLTRLFTFPHRLLSGFITAKAISDGPSDKNRHIHQLSHWRGAKAWPRSQGFSPVIEEVPNQALNWVWRLNCPLRDLTVTELPSTDWRLFPPSNLQSPEFNSPKSITTHGEGAWLTQQPQTARQPLLQTCSVQSCRTINSDFMLPNGLSSNMALHERYCFCHAWKMHAHNEIVLWKHLAPCALWKYECIILYQNKAVLLNCQK